mgnify:CR=1 FL=1
MSSRSELARRMNPGQQGSNPKTFVLEVHHPSSMDDVLHDLWGSESLQETADSHLRIVRLGSDLEFWVDGVSGASTLLVPLQMLIGRSRRLWIGTDGWTGRGCRPNSFGTFGREHRSARSAPRSTPATSRVRQCPRVGSDCALVVPMLARSWTSWAPCGRLAARSR